MGGPFRSLGRAFLFLWVAILRGEALDCWVVSHLRRSDLFALSHRLRGGLIRFTPLALVWGLVGNIAWI